MMRRVLGLGLALWVLLLTACGGGGGDSGGCLLCGGSGGGTGGGSGGGTTTTYGVQVSIKRLGVATTSITSTETAQAVARVVDSAGQPVQGVVVSFGETGASLIKFAPASATALTGADGIAQLDMAAASTSLAGATTINASATVGGGSYAASVSVEVKAGSVVGTPAVPAAINFVSVSPAGVAIVIKGAGGNGRTESASLTFKVVDASNAPIQGAVVKFSANPATDVTLNITSATSDANGMVTTTVQSSFVPTAVVIKAVSATNANVFGQSDSLIISNGVAVAGGFEVVAEKYNLDGLLTGDKTKVSAYVRDTNGNPVADGVVVSFTTDLGAIGSSKMGGCTTTNGTCSVDFWVQEPRGDGLATVIGATRVSETTVLSDSIQINMSGASGGYLAQDAAGSIPVRLDLSTSCKRIFELYLKDGAGRSPAANSVIAVSSVSSDVTVTMKSGSPVLDALDFRPTLFSFEVDASSDNLLPKCNPSGVSALGGYVRLSYTTPNKQVMTQRFDLYYRQ